MTSGIQVHGNKEGAKHQYKKRFVKVKPRSARPWGRLRKRILIRDRYTCQQCGKIDVHLQVDHKKPRAQGGTDDEENLQSLCDMCHSIKTSNENDSLTSTMFPEWLPVSTRPFIVVCGRPAAGKSTYVSERLKPGDLVVDLDLMAEEIGRQLHTFSPQERHGLVRMRNQRIASYINGEINGNKCYIVTVAGSPSQREFWKARGAEIIIIDTPVDICQRRINGQDLPTWRKIERLEVARLWQGENNPLK